MLPAKHCRMQGFDGLAKSLDEVPSAPTTRLTLGTPLTVRLDLFDARRILLPLAAGPFDPPVKGQARQLLGSLLAKRWRRTAPPRIDFPTGVAMGRLRRGACLRCSRPRQLLGFAP